MKLQEALDYLNLESLPKAEQKSNNKCIALVRRTNNTKDYAIVHNGGIIADIGFKAAIIEILEYYPKRREGKEQEVPPVVTKPKEKEPEAPKEPESESEVGKHESEVGKREKMLLFLQSKKMKLATINALEDLELEKLCAVHGEKF